MQLRPFQAQDAPVIVRWITSEYMMRQWCGGHFQRFPLSAYELVSFYETHADYIPLTAVDEYGVCGHLFFAYKDEAKSNFRLCLVIVDASRRGQGIGQAMLQSALRLAFLADGLKRVTLGVFCNNSRAERCYRSVGFVEDIDAAGKPHFFDGVEWPGREMVFTREAAYERGFLPQN